jgi:hypothetical protein
VAHALIKRSKEGKLFVAQLPEKANRNAMSESKCLTPWATADHHPDGQQRTRIVRDKEVPSAPIFIERSHIHIVSFALHKAFH